MKKYFVLQDFNFKNKYVLVRVDFNVPLKNGKVADDFKIQQSLPTIDYIIGHGGIPLLLSHLGRPQGVDESLRMTSIVECLQKLTRHEVLGASDCVGAEVEEAVRGLHQGSVLVLENVRFHVEEEANDDAFARNLAGLADLFVMDAFGTMHRSHASVVGVPKYLPSAAGLLVQKEVEVLHQIFSAPKRPFVGIMGGAKISSKFGVMCKLEKKVDMMLVGGALASSVYKSRGVEVGKSFVEPVKKKNWENMLLPADFAVAASLKDRYKIVAYDAIPKNMAAYDIGPRTIKYFTSVLKDARTVFMNGTLGVCEQERFAFGTDTILRFLTTLDATVVVGGGETVDAARPYAKKLTHVSTGGGATLEYVEKGSLPGIDALVSNYKKYKNIIL